MKIVCVEFAENALAQGVTRTMTFSVMISEDSAYISTAQGQWEVPWVTLQD